MSDPTVLYIAGWSRSGSTLLAQVLGQAEGWFSCGELRLLPLNFADLHVVHLVRDPRAAAFSWGRRKLVLRPDVHLPTLSPARSSANWLRRNLAIEAVVRPQRRQRFTRVRYEDFVAHPRGLAGTLGALVEGPGTEIPFRDERRVDLGPSHTVGGNPVRHARGELAIPTRSGGSAWTIGPGPWPRCRRFP